MLNMESRTVAQILVEQFVSRLGIPDKVQSDQGRQFVNKLFIEMCGLLQVDKTRTSPYHAESDGMVERFNRKLCCSMLNTYVNNKHKD